MAKAVYGCRQDAKGEVNKRLRKEQDYLYPKEASKKLSLAWKEKRAAYLYGTAGIGKTALPAHQFANRNMTLWSAGSCRPEQILVPEDGKRHIVVLDDLHAVTDGDERAAYVSLIRSFLERRDVWLVMISRAPVPGWLLPLHIQYLFVLIQEEEFYFTKEQEMEYLEQRGIRLGKEDFQKARELTEGRPVFVRIFAMRNADAEQTERDIGTYMETHVYDQWDMETQTFIMETSIVDQFTEELASMITGSSSVRRLLQQAEELGNFFTQTGQKGIWQYVRYLRVTMRQRLCRKYRKEKLGQLYYNAGLYYEMHDDTPKALEMYELSGNSESISRVLTSNARKNPTSGHYYEMRRFYLSIPEDTVRKNPVLMAALSMLQSILMNEEESERWYHLLEKYAKTHSGSEGREAKSRLLYLDIGLPHRGSKGLAGILKYTGMILQEKGASLPEFSVTSNIPSLMNGGKDFCAWSKRDRELAASIGSLVQFVLGKYGKGLVSLALSESFLEKGMDNYEVMRLAEKGRMSAESGGKVELCFVAAGILVWLSVLNGNAEYAGEILDAFRKRAKKDAPNLLLNLDAFRCRIWLYQGDLPHVMEWMETAPDEKAEFATLERYRYMTKARVYLQNGKYEAACGLLEQVRFYAKKMGRTYIWMESGLLLSVAFLRMGRKEWKEMLQQCVTEAEDYHFVRLLSREGAAIWNALKGDLCWKDKSFREQTLQECGQMAKLYPRYLEPGADSEIVLSENALRILRLQAEGETLKNIANKLGIQEATVKYHCGETYRKLGVRGKIEAVNEARKRRLI